MRTPGTPSAAARMWLVRSIVVVVVVIAVSAILFLLHRSAPPREVEPGLAHLPKPRSGYVNRAIRPRDPGRAEAPKTPAIRGVVYDEAGKAVQGARVSATTFQIAGNQSTVAAAAESDSLGRFSMWLPEGTYYLSAGKQDYSPTLAVARGGEEVSLVLRRSGEVTGHVRDAGGRPITRFVIDVLAPGTDDMAAPAPFLSKEIASDDGSYRLSELPREGVFLRAKAPGLSPALSAMVTVGPGKSETVDFTLSAGCVLSGTVVDGDGLPLADVLVDAELRRSAGVIGTTSIDAASQSETDEHGRFRIENVPVGAVMVRAYDGTHAVANVEVQIDACAGLGPLRVEMTAGSTLSGLVKDSEGKPVSGARLTLSNRGTGFVETTADGEGRYRFEKLPPGGMRLEAQAGEERALVLVTVSPSVEVEQDITLPAGGKGEIRGRVTASGKPLSGVQITIVSNAGNGTLGSRNPVTGPDGAFRATGLRDGVYAVIAGSTGQLAQVKIDGGSSETADIDVGTPPDRGTIPKGALEARERAAARKAAAEKAAADSPSPEDEAPAPQGDGEGDEE